MTLGHGLIKGAKAVLFLVHHGCQLPKSVDVYLEWGGEVMNSALYVKRNRGSIVGAGVHSSVPFPSSAGFLSIIKKQCR